MSIVTTSLVCGAAAAAAAYVGGTMLPWPGFHEWIFPHGMWRTTPEAVGLTFDDGPHPQWTPAVLDLLGESGAAATFFVIGERAARFPELVARMAREGHGIGNHTWSHASLPVLGRARIGEEIDRCQDAIAAVTGSAPRLLRAPFGRRDHRVYQEAQRRGLTPVFWSVDSRDWRSDDAARIRRRLSRARGGDIVLLHDAGQERRGMLAALHALLRRLARDRLLVAPLRGS